MALHREPPGPGGQGQTDSRDGARAGPLLPEKAGAWSQPGRVPRPLLDSPKSCLGPEPRAQGPSLLRAASRHSSGSREEAAATPPVTTLQRQI